MAYPHHGVGSLTMVWEGKIGFWLRKPSWGYRNHGFGIATMVRATLTMVLGALTMVWLSLTMVWQTLTMVWGPETTFGRIYPFGLPYTRPCAGPEPGQTVSNDVESKPTKYCDTRYQVS